MSAEVYNYAIEHVKDTSWNSRNTFVKVIRKQSNSQSVICNYNN